MSHVASDSLPRSSLLHCLLPSLHNSGSSASILNEFPTASNRLRLLADAIDYTRTIRVSLIEKSCGELVEAAGVEPASENVTGQETTCVVQFMLPELPGNVRGRRSERTRNASR